MTTDEAFTLLVAATDVGAPGTVAGTAAAEGEEAAPVPTRLVASTSNSYEVPLVSPVAVHVVVEHVAGDVVAVLYEV